MGEMTSLERDTQSRKRIVSDINTNFFVEAGAGSGRGYVEDDTAGYDGTESTYYLKNSFFVKSSAESNST